MQVQLEAGHSAQSTEYDRKFWCWCWRQAHCCSGNMDSFCGASAAGIRPLTSGFHLPPVDRLSQTKPWDELQLPPCMCMLRCPSWMFTDTHSPGWRLLHKFLASVIFVTEHALPVSSIQSTCLLSFMLARAPIQYCCWPERLLPFDLSQLVLNRDESNSGSGMVASCMPSWVQVWFACSQVFLPLYLTNRQAVATATTSEPTAISLYPENFTTKCACVLCVSTVWSRGGSTCTAACFI